MKEQLRKYGIINKEIQRMAELKDTRVQGNLDVSGSLTVAGTITSVAGGAGILA